MKNKDNRAPFRGTVGSDLDILKVRTFKGIPGALKNDSAQKYLWGFTLNSNFPELYRT